MSITTSCDVCGKTFTDPYRTAEDPGEMRLRDQFAMAAMKELMPRLGGDFEDFDEFAEEAYSVADAMLKARQKKF